MKTPPNLLKKYNSIKSDPEADLAHIKSNFEVLTKAFIELQKKDVLLSYSLVVVKNLKQKFSLF